MKIVFKEELFEEICKKNNLNKKGKTYKKTIQELYTEKNINISFEDYILNILVYDKAI